MEPDQDRVDVVAAAVSLTQGNGGGLLSTAVVWGSAAAMMFGGVVPYVPQYREIKSTDNADGFSLQVCFALLMANCLRILFWFGHPFEFPLLFQSVIMVFAMFMLIHLCVRVKHRTQIIRGRDRHFSDFDSTHFWAWTDFMSYIECTMTFATVLGLFTYVFLDNFWFVECTGFAAVFVEAMLGVPQFVRNHTSQSTDGMSKNMVLMWFCGDIFKTGYFYFRDSPPQFYLCGALQVSIDVAILVQIVIYRGRTKPSTYVS